MKLRVAVFNTQPPHLYVGGVERRIIEVAQKLSTSVRTTVYSGTKKGFNKKVSSEGTNLVPCFSTDKVFPVDNWLFNRTISRMFKHVKADVYESHNVSGYGFLKALTKRNLSSRFIQTIHGPLMDDYIQNRKFAPQTLWNKITDRAKWHLSRIEQELAKNSELIITVSSYSAKKITYYYDVDPSKIRIVPNGVDCNRFTPIEDSDTIKSKIGINGKQCILFVGQLVPRKGLSYLIEAAQEITKERDDVVFVLAGDGPLRNSLVRQLEKTALSDYFVFLGDVWGDILPTIYNCADVFVFPSIQEGQGIALLEAQAVAKPVVAFNSSAVKETVKNKETGILVKHDSYELANATLDLLSNKSLREKLGHSGRERVRRQFSWDICAEKMLRIYKEAAC